MKAVIINDCYSILKNNGKDVHQDNTLMMSSYEFVLRRILHLLGDAEIKEAFVLNNGLGETQEDPQLPIHCIYVNNTIDVQEDKSIIRRSFFDSTVDNEVVILRGNLVFENEVIDTICSSPKSVYIKESNKFGICKINGAEWGKLIEGMNSNQSENKILDEGVLEKYLEDAAISEIDIQGRFCTSVEKQEDAVIARSKIEEIESRIVYMAFSTDIIHGGHISIIKKAQRLGKLVIGVTSDEVVASYKRLPLVPASERKIMFENISGVYKVVDQNTLSYKENIERIKPDIVVHGDDWCTGFQKPIRDEVVSLLASYGGRLVEYPYSKEKKYADIDARTRSNIAMPDVRRGSLRKMLDAKGLITAMEAHDGLTGLIVENTVVHQDGGAHQFDAMWISSLCDSTAKGKPDIELVDMTSRFRTIEDITEVTTKPIIFDGDTGGKTEHFVYTVRTLERLGVSMIIIEDKTGLKQNSLFGTEVVQTQDSIENFSEKIMAGKKAQRTKEFMICARIESLILERGLDDALERAFAFVSAGADAIMIHSRRKDPSEIESFIEEFRKKDIHTPIVLVPTSFNSVKEEEWKEKGANIIIYANQLMRAEVPAMQKAAEVILQNHRAEECDKFLMPFKDIIRLIPPEV